MHTTADELRRLGFEHLVLTVCGVLLADRFGPEVEGVIAGVEADATDFVTVLPGQVVDADELMLTRVRFQAAVKEAARGLRAAVGGLLLQAEREGTEGAESPTATVAGALGLDARLTALERLLGVSKVGGEGSDASSPDLLARLMVLERFLPVLVAAAADADPVVAQRLSELAED